MKLTYSGKYPVLCFGKLTVTDNSEKTWEFPEHCLSSGGHVWFDNNWFEHVERGSWTISEWPKDFPEELKTEVLELVNREIPRGCCGGCV